MEETVTIVSSPDVKKLLDIVKIHLGYIKRSRSKEIVFSTEGPLPLKINHAIVASIFSAAAIEAGINLYISLPILFIKDENMRRLFSALVYKSLRLPVRQKLDFVFETCTQIKQDKKLLKRVRTLFDYRNSLLHSSPEYIEQLAPDESKTWLDEDGFEVGGFIKKPTLLLRGTSSDELEKAFQHYETALDFLSKLPAEVILAKDGA
jgi:hypothetical protein